MPRKRTRYREYSTVINGKLYAVVNIPLGGGRYRQKRKRVASKLEAQQWATEQMGLHLEGEDLFESSSRKFADFAAWYKKEYCIPPVYEKGKKLDGLRTWQHQEQAVDRLTARLGRFDLNKITIDVLRREKRERLKTVSITTVNREFALLRTMFKKAKRRKWMRENPFDLEESLIVTSLESRRVPTLNDRTAVRLLARSRKSEQPLLFYLVAVHMFTGGRPSEIFPYKAVPGDDVPREPLAWKNILKHNFRAVTLVSYKGNVRKERWVPTLPFLEKVLRRFHIESKGGPDDLLFPLTSFKRSWATLCRSCKVSGVRLRDFRHYYNSWAVPRMNDMERMLIMGHTEMPTNARYSHLDESFIDKYRAAGVIESEVLQ